MGVIDSLAYNNVSSYFLLGVLAKYRQKAREIATTAMVRMIPMMVVLDKRIAISIT